MDAGRLLLPPEALRQPCRPGDLGDVPQEEPPGPPVPLGQDAALDALEVGLSVRGAGFHVYVAGPSGTGRRTTVTAMLERVAAELPLPPDRVHVPRFDDPRRPRLVTLAPGRGVRFGALVEEFSRALALRAGTLLEDRGVDRRREALVHRFRADEEARLAELRARLAAVGVGLVVDESSTPQPFDVIPVQDGAPVSLERLEEDRGPATAAAMRETLAGALGTLRDHLREARGRRRALDEQLRGTYERAARTVVDEELRLITDEFSGPVIDTFVADVRLDAIDGLADFAEGGADAGPRLQARLQRYGPGLTADRTGHRHAPVIVDDGPSRESLFGSIPDAVDGPIGPQFDLSRITTGSVLRADGGFLVLDVDDLLRRPGAWEPLRRVLRTGRYEPGAGGSRPIEPESVPVDVKVVLIGPRERFDELRRADAIFAKSFGVRVDFGLDTPRTAAAERRFATVTAGMARAARLPAVTADGLAALVEVGAELSGRRDRLTTSFAAVERVLREAAFRAGRRGVEAVERADVEAARAAQIRRDDDEPDLRAVTWLLTGRERRVGRVLALEAPDAGPTGHGGVLRVTASPAAAGLGAVSVERGAAAPPACGPDAGGLVLAGFLRRRYPGAALGVTVTAEGPHGLVPLRFDVVTVSEVVAAISVLADLPVDPSLAVAGTVDATGDVGPAGALGDRLRVFHGLLARADDRTPRGAVASAAEAGTLMLPGPLVADAAAGRFAVHAVGRIEEALELLLDAPVEAIDRRVLERAEARVPEGV